MKRLMSIILVAACCTAVGWCQDVEDWVTRTLAQYPRARLLDIYKSCFQDYMGAEHLVNDLATARAYLEQEYTTTAVEDLLPWYYEPCGINGNYVRVSLRAVFDGKIKREEINLCGCYIDEERGVLKVTDVTPADFPPVLPIFPEGAYHLYDYQFFYRNLQENVANRVKIYLESLLDNAA